MIPELVYALCAVTSAVCAGALWRMQLRTRLRLLFWCALGFAALTVNNILLFVDKILLPATDLTTVRLVTVVIGFGALCYGLIWESDR